MLRYDRHRNNRLAARPVSRVADPVSVRTDTTNPTGLDPLSTRQSFWACVADPGQMEMEQCYQSNGRNEAYLVELWRLSARSAITLTPGSLPLVCDRSSRALTSQRVIHVQNHTLLSPAFSAVDGFMRATVAGQSHPSGYCKPSRNGI